MIGIINKSFKEYCGKFGLNQLLALSPRMYIPSLPDKTDIIIMLLQMADK